MRIRHSLLALGFLVLGVSYFLLRTWEPPVGLRTLEPPAVTILPMAADEDAPLGEAVATGFSDADYERHLEELTKRLPSEEFAIVLEKPFFVVGDVPPARVKRLAKGTVRWAADKLKEAFFEKDPMAILDVWLFKDKVSYEKHAVEIFGTKPHTPFGYYSSHHRALVMNIDTGSGTLVHEIVHPFVEANFPDCPPWLNEGLGSLYEQCMDHEGKIWGLTNWRLEGLQKTIWKGKLAPFETLFAMGGGEFYGRNRGDNYAQARYLLYYLQEKGLLRKYYRAFFADRKGDPTGYATLVEILGKPDMERFQADWESWVRRLRYSPR